MKTALCLLFFFLPLFAGYAYSQASNTPHTIAEHMPQFPGGNDSLIKYMADNVLYPDDAIESDIQGKVYVEFTVDTAGNVINPRIIKSVHPLLDSSAIAVIRYMPQWVPGQDGNRKVPCYVKLPVNFHLEGDTKKKAAVNKLRSAKSQQAKLTSR